MKGLLITVCLLITSTVFSQQKFNNLSSFIEYVNEKNIGLQNNSIKELRAKKAKLAAIIGIVDPQGNNDASFINNTKLPVSVFPAELTGGEPGTTQEIETGTQYNTRANQSLDIKLLNLEGWKNLKLSKINLEITETDSKLNKKSLYENIASTYYNIVQLQEQQISTQRSISVSDSLLRIVENKYNEGLVKQQDVNDSRVNLITIQENEKQIQFLIQQNYISLKILADIPENVAIVIEEKVDELSFFKPEIEKNMLSASSLSLKEEYALQDFKRTKMSRLPTLSFVGSQSFNQYNQDFTFTGGNWISSNYVGLKLKFSLPSSKSVSERSNAKYNYQLAQQNSRQALIQADLNHQKLGIEWEKAQSQVKHYEEVLEIQKDTYTKNKSLYAEGLQGIDRTLDSLNTLVTTEYNVISSKVNVMLAQAKIDVNNQIR